ncbi:cell division protein ZapA [Oleiphilus sp. HI0071]|jgi:cell division protein ZapA|uniref:cell division protein ZapA n=3 Tax=Oleiphilus TaxID=141450 RepID=UPI0007C3D937|nr:MULTISPECIES: cell division protein ZapA [unclassified Oleiphilus]KZY60782.1 cell division protein ZapA [Oleiphilus sp. HI0065]KZY86499.1 cell division protein ZapA [Oleiphilus sp. HI0071]KZZ06055.1 cell division protein ZapA [Oleiphilus sp. HI0073]KZZ49411.1 cell division protein ZapA [Oleiphilus sp. HI0122]KZZ51541.1 cell division protein ZapA [Oleiphilus sp. HI0118]KZZ69855.1 cell division protein ZapA [Oleiphilus sp. HI0130]KZZ77582.1 cell division protein ZapA [Oleiphilus sp. HI0133]
MSEQNTLEVRILDKEYLVACPPDKQKELREASVQLDAKMREIRGSGKVFGSERIAVMAALNLTYELMQSSMSSSGEEQKLSKLEAQMDQILAAKESR